MSISFLNTLYTDGQYMATRISRAIQKETQKLSKLLAQYNSFDGRDHDEVTWSQVTDLSSSIWADDGIETENQEVPRNIRLTAINALEKRNRATEEQELIKQEMINAINHYMRIYQTLKSIPLPNLQTCTRYEQGCRVLLHQKIVFYKSELVATMEAFKCFVKIPIVDLSNDDEPETSVDVGYVHGYYLAVNMDQTCMLFQSHGYLIFVTILYTCIYNTVRLLFYCCIC